MPLSLGWIGRAINSSGRTDTGVMLKDRLSVLILIGSIVRKIDECLKWPSSGRYRSDGSKYCCRRFPPQVFSERKAVSLPVVFIPDRQPILNRFFWRVWPEPNEDLLNIGAEKLIGRHDFSSFGKPSKKGGSTS